MYDWEFERDGRELRVRVEGQLTLSNLSQRIDAAESGLGLAYVPESSVLDALQYGRLVRVLESRAPRLKDITSIIQAVDSTQPRSGCFSMPCGSKNLYHLVIIKESDD